MPLTVLTDSDVRQLLLSLTKEDAEELQTSLSDALHEYSTGAADTPCCSSTQPQRTVIKKKDMLTLFMPASAGQSVGMKIISIPAPHKSEDAKSFVSSSSGHASLKSVMSDLSGVSLDSATTTRSSTGSVDGANFRPGSIASSTVTGGPKGTVSILDSTGSPQGILNAAELTAFRTALASTMIVQKRSHVHTITVFGAGRAAYWHIRLALLFRAGDIRHINIINRNFERSIELMKSFQGPDAPEGWKKTVKFSALSPEFGEYGRLLKEEVRKADVIFCCTPSTEPLFPAEFLTSREGQKKGRYITAIGSYTKDMIELHPDIMRMAVSPHHEHHHFHKHAKRAGVIIVDSLEACMKDAGEIIQAKLTPEQLIEVGELMIIKKAALKEIEKGGTGERDLLEWLTKGNVIYKSVGLGLMDLVVGEDLVRLARERDVGTTIADF